MTAILAKCARRRAAKRVHFAYKSHSALGVVAICALSSVAQAQVASPVVPVGVTSEGQVSEVGDIVVTAQKRQQSVQDVPIAISAFSSTDLAARHVDNAEGLSKVDPSVSLVNQFGGGVPVVVIRGVGLQDFRINNTPTTAFYIDEVYQSSVATADQAFFDLADLEILKGPQGGLYGRNTTAGAVLVNSAKPRLGEFGGYASIGYGSYGTFESEGALNVPLGEDVAGRVSGRFVQGASGPWHSVSDGGSWGAPNRYAVRGMLRWAPANWDVLLKVDGGRDRSETPPARVVGIWAPGLSPFPNFANGPYQNNILKQQSTAVICPALAQGRKDNATCVTSLGLTPLQLGLDSDPYSTLSGNIGKLNNKWFNISLQPTYKFGSFEAKSITSYSDTNPRRVYDLAGLPPGLDTIYGSYHTKIPAFSQEFRIAYDSPGLSWIVGANYAQDIQRENTPIFADVGTVPLFFRTRQILQTYRQKTKQWAAYGHLEMNISSNLSGIVELRYTDERKTFTGQTLLVDRNFVNISVNNVRTGYGDPSGKVGLTWKPSRDLMAYASISRAIKSGGVFGGVPTSALQLTPYNPEKNTSYEVGVKSRIFDRTLALSGSIYHYDYHDFQGNAFQVVGIASVNRLTNLGDATFNGAEVSADWTPTATTGLKVGLAYVDAKLNKSDAVTADVFSAGNHSLQGLTLPNAPKWKFDIAARQTFALSTSLNLTAHADYNYRSSQDFKFITIPAEVPIFHEGAYGLLGARLALAPSDERWTIAIWGRNLANKAYRSAAGQTGIGDAYEIYGMPRTFGAEFRTTFGAGR